LGVPPKGSQFVTSTETARRDAPNILAGRGFSFQVCSECRYLKMVEEGRLKKEHKGGLFAGLARNDSKTDC